MLPPERSIIVSMPYLSLQHEWLRFLNGADRDCPGLYESARLLFVTLLFGLARLEGFLYCDPTATDDVEQYSLFTPAQVYSFAKSIVLRMVRARTESVAERLAENSRNLTGRVLDRLRERPHTDRAMSRRFHSMPVTVCREVLGGLEPAEW